jgi:YVTN family beta-propeller protein
MMSTGRYVLLRTLTLILGMTSAYGQVVEVTIPLPDSLPKLGNVRGLVFHAPNTTIYVGGEDTFLIAIDAETNVKLDKTVKVGHCPSDIWYYRVLCSDPPGNKIYCSNRDSAITVIDGATNQPVKTIPVEQVATALVYNELEDKLYCASDDSLLRVIDCAGDSLVARVPVGSGPSALCYNPQLNRIYSAHPDRDEVKVIDCGADTVVATVWVRGVQPRAICYDSASGCVYTANGTSNTVSVIDCAGDTVSQVVTAGQDPFCIRSGPPGKVYGANVEDSTVSVISSGGVKTITTGRGPCDLSYDPVNNKIYCANYYAGTVSIIDATADSVLVQIRAGRNPRYLCYNPTGNSTCVASYRTTDIQAIGGASDAVEHVIPLGPCSPDALCYNPVGNRLYCLDAPNDLLFIVDAESSRTLEPVKTGSSPGRLVLSPSGGKAYFTAGSGAVSIFDCIQESIIGSVTTGSWTRLLCLNEAGDVYVAVRNGVAVIDGSGDTIRAVMAMPNNTSFSAGCYDRTDGKVYVGYAFVDSAVVNVIDVRYDSVVATIRIRDGRGYQQALCWEESHDKLYASCTESDSVVVIDCVGDTILKRILVTTDIVSMYSDSACGKVYCVDHQARCLHIIDAATDTYYRSLPAGLATALLDNVKQGPANRLYCTDEDGGAVRVIAGYKTDSILARVSVGDWPSALAWDPTHSRMYVANAGSSSITVIRDTLLLDVEEGEAPAVGRRPEATVVRGMLMFSPANGAGRKTSGRLLDVSGREVLDLLPGSNDVRALAPGVYFVTERLATGMARPGLRKVLIVR